MSKKFLTTLLAGLLCGSLAATGGQQDGGMATEEQTVDGERNYRRQDLYDVLDGIVNYEADTAGGSLKNVIAAAELVEFLSKEETSADKKMVIADINAWYEGLTADERRRLAENWPKMLEEAKAISDDPESQQDILDDAGVTTDFQDMDLSASQEILDNENLLR
ncbi:MAG: hypothetical protein U0L91_06725 [Gemmiger sp.]|uniref:hypothetical protein n=1 Tax=Gemmiger sp. TaxID=2049027 RepID=UPI002E78FFD8|nr:hypothetical protein [Gemmiger sp.]MEE0800957.1 hypothetical protein [Gemmiger sp.]